MEALVAKVEQGALAAMRRGPLASQATEAVAAVVGVARRAELALEAMLLAGAELEEESTALEI